MNAEKLLKIAKYLERNNLVEEGRRIRKLANGWNDLRNASLGATLIVDILSNPLGALQGTAYRDAVISGLIREKGIPPAQQYQFRQDMEIAWNAASATSAPPNPKSGTVQGLLDWLGVPDIQAGFQGMYDSALGDTPKDSGE
jgi:hypothetical protein